MENGREVLCGNLASRVPDGGCPRRAFGLPWTVFTAYLAAQPVYTNCFLTKSSEKTAQFRSINLKKRRFYGFSATFRAHLSRSQFWPKF
jgi:hypothetical protein